MKTAAEVSVWVVAAMEELRQHFGSIRVPQGGDKVYKDECMFSFDTPVSQIFISRCNWCDRYGEGAAFRSLLWRRVVSW